VGGGGAMKGGGRGYEKRYGEKPLAHPLYLFMVRELHLRRHRHPLTYPYVAARAVATLPLARAHILIYDVAMI